MANFFSSIFKPNVSNEGFQQIPLTSDQILAMNTLTDMLKQDVVFPQLNVRDKTQLESSAQNILKSVISGDIGQKASGAFMDMLNRPQDVTKDPYYKAILKDVNEGTARDISQMGRILLKGKQITSNGSASTPARNYLVREGISRGATSRTEALLPFQQNADQLRLQAGQGLLSTALTRAGASQMDIDALLANQKNSAEYQQAMNNIMYSLQGKQSVAANILGSPGEMYNPGIASPSTALQVGYLTAALGKLAGAVNPFGMGGGSIGSAPTQSQAGSPTILGASLPSTGYQSYGGYSYA